MYIYIIFLVTHSLIAGRYDGPAAVRLIPELAQKKQQQADEAKAKFAADAEVICPQPFILPLFPPPTFPNPPKLHSLLPSFVLNPGESLLCPEW
jgi:hypothetical protein